MKRMFDRIEYAFTHCGIAAVGNCDIVRTVFWMISAYAIVNVLCKQTNHIDNGKTYASKNSWE